MEETGQAAGPALRRGGMTKSLRAVLAVIATALLVAAVTLVVATDWLAGLRSDEAAKPVGKTAGRSPEEIEEFWTEQRMREAEPAPMPPVDGGPSLEGMVFVGALLVTAVGSVVAVWLAFRPLDSTVWGPDIRLGRLMLLVVTSPIAITVLAWHRVRSLIPSSG